jgi:cytochrome c oxidase subunit 3
MSEAALTQAGPQEGMDGLVDDWSSDKQTYHVPWGKAMMWIFLVSDTFIFTCFLTAYLHVRLTTTEPSDSVDSDRSNDIHSDY